MNGRTFWTGGGLFFRKKTREDFGARGEGAAEEYLKRKGYRILDRNYRAPCGEIDLIALDGKTVVFVEVKSRRSTRYGEPVEAVHARKRKRIAGAALYFLKRYEVLPPCRFDVISVYEVDGRTLIKRVEDAFELS